MKLMEHCSPNSQGFGNRLFVCEIHQQDDGIHETDCPLKILVRLYGGNVLPKDAPTRILDETTETMVFYGLGMKGLGPKLYGTFEGGRLEEFIESSAISVKDWAEDSNINKEVARIVADYHSQDFPLVKQPQDIVKILEECYAGYLKIKNEVARTVTPEEFEAARDFFEFDVLTECSWIRKVLPLVNSRVVFSHNDVNRGNHLVRNSDKKIILVDYEFSGYCYRGFEIGNYFGMKMFDFGAEKFRTGYDYPNEEYRREFIMAYSERIKQNGYFAGDWHDSDDNAIDSVDHIVMEAEFGSFAVRLINVAWCLRDALNWIKVIRMRSKFDPDFEFGKAFTTVSHFYQQRKQVFLKAYPQFNV